MKKLFLCNLLFIKKGLKKISFVILLMALPILCYFLKTSIDNSDITIKAGIYINTTNETVIKICNDLFENYESVHFEKCADLDSLKNKVASGYYECGYVFNSDFENKIAECDLTNIVDLYTSPGTLTVAMVNEYVFSEIFVEYGFNELVNFISTQNIFKIKDISELSSTLRPQYDYYMNSDDTFSFKYVNADNEDIDNSSLLSSYVLLSVRGIVSLIIMFSAFLGTLNLYKDSKTGVFKAFSKVLRHFCKMSEIFSLTILSCISGLISIYICNLGENFTIECLKLLVYAVICTVYCYIIYKIVPNPYLFTSLIPVFILGSIIFCPIFMDISEIIPVAKYISWIFLPKYYFI